MGCATGVRGRATIAGSVGNVGGRIEVELESAVAGNAAHGHRHAGAGRSRYAGNCSASAASVAQGKVIGRDIADRLAEIHREINAGVGGHRAAHRRSAGDGRPHTVDDQGSIGAERPSRTRRWQGQDSTVVCGIADGASVQGQRASSHIVQVGALVARLHGVAERQGGGATSAGVIHHPVDGAGLQRDLRCTGERDGLAEVHLDADDIASLVGAVGGGRGDANDGGCDAVDDDVLVRPQRIGSAWRWQGQDRVVVGSVPDRATVQRERTGVHIVQIGRGIAGLHGVTDRQGGGTTSAGIVHRPVYSAGFQRELRCTGDIDGLTEIHLSADDIASLVGAVGSAA